MTGRSCERCRSMRPVDVGEGRVTVNSHTMKDKFDAFALVWDTTTIFDVCTSTEAKIMRKLFQSACNCSFPSASARKYLISSGVKQAYFCGFHILLCFITANLPDDIFLGTNPSCRLQDY